jgi:protein MpaA
MSFHVASTYQADKGMKSSLFGTTRMGLPIVKYEAGWQGPHVMIIAAVHGDEVEGVTIARCLLQQFSEAFPFQLRLTLIPEFNPEGVLAHRRWNSNNVDLNRNLPTKDWTPVIKNPRYPPGPTANSEPENQALVKFLDHDRPDFILSLHSYSFACINPSGDAWAEANLFGQWTGYPVVESIGYETPGCLGTYAGTERGIPNITYEVKRDLPLDQVIKLHMPGMIEFLKLIERSRRRG